MEFIEELLKEKKSLQERIKAINVLLRAYDVSEEKIISIEQQTSLFNDKESISFPTNARRDKQILWMFNNVFNNAVKISSIQDKYDELSKSNNNISNIVRRLNKEGKLAIVKYNKQNRASFWGLSEWIDNNDFKENFKPDENLLPIDIETTEVVMG